jgi:hypothetical protein
MSLADDSKVAVVAVLRGNPRVVLVARDDGEVPDPTQREDALQRKLSTYLQFVMSGQFARAYPKFAEREIAIAVVCVNAPTDGMLKINGIQDHGRPETFMPVEILTDAEFRAALKRE